MEHFAPDDTGETVRLAKVDEFYNVPIIFSAQDSKQVFDAVPELKLKSDDVMLCTHLKTGL